MISIVIPTFNRADLWKSGIVWRFILRQTVYPHEVLICDDGSTDDTLAVLCAELFGGPLPFTVRLFRVTAAKQIEGGGPAIAENVLLKEAAGDTLLHLDDDGLISKRLVEFVTSLHVAERPGVYWGKLEFIDQQSTLPLDHRDPRTDRYPRREGVYVLRTDQLDAYGALWAAPTKLLREIGGHDMAGAGYRGNDSRLGHRLNRLSSTPNYFVTDRAMRFRHFGIPTQYALTHGEARRKGMDEREARFEAAQDLKRFRETHRTPQLGNVRLDRVANGGDAFWSGGALDGMYEEIRA